MALALLLMSSVWVANAHSQVTPFTAVDVTCEVLDPGTTTVDEAGVTHVRGTISKGIISSDHELIAGTSYIMVDEVTEPESDITGLTVTSFIYPDAAQGSWVSPGQGQVSPEGLLVRHDGRGTGDLSHAFIAFEVRAATVDPATLPCEPVIPPAELTGLIIGGKE
jgi:hypothetical protein